MRLFPLFSPIKTNATLLTCARACISPAFKGLITRDEWPTSLMLLCQFPNSCEEDSEDADTVCQFAQLVFMQLGICTAAEGNYTGLTFTDTQHQIPTPLRLSYCSRSHSKYLTTTCSLFCRPQTQNRSHS